MRQEPSESDASLTLPCGLTVRFRQAARPSGTLLPEAVQRAILTAGNFEAYVNDARSKGPFGPVVIVNHFGSWINMAAHAARMGLSEIEIWQNPRTSVSLTDCRRYLYAARERVVALPNYKCGYSSLKNVFGQLWSGESSKNISSICQDGNLPVSELPASFIFSIVRDPFERFVSFYVDKFMRPPTHFNYLAWKLPHQTLLGNDFGPDMMLWLIEHTPLAFADLHWKPFSANLMHEGRPLFNRVYDITESQRLSEDLSSLLDRSIVLPRVNVTDDVDHDEAFEGTKNALNRLQRVYAADFAFLEKLRALGGSAASGSFDQAPPAAALTMAG